MTETTGSRPSADRRPALPETRSSLRKRLRIYAFVGLAVVGAWLYSAVNAVVGLYDTTLTIERATDMRERVGDAQVGLNEAEEGIDRYTLNGQGYDLSRHRAGRTSLSAGLDAIQRRPMTPATRGLLERSQAAARIFAETSDATIATWNPDQPAPARVMRNDQIAPAAEQLREILSQLQQSLARTEASAEERLKDSRDTAWAALAVLAVLIVSGLLWLLSDVNRRILTPCAAAAQALETLAAGQQPPRMPDQSADEVGELGRNFNRVAQIHFEQVRALEERDIEASVNAVLSEAAAVNDLGGFAGRVMEKVLEVSGASSAVLYLPESGGSYAAAAAVGGGGVTDGPVGPEEARRAADQRKPIFLSVEPQTPTLNLFDGRVLPRESAHIPLIYFDNVVGVLALGSAHGFRRRARNTLTAIAPSLAVAVANAAANERVAEQSRRLSEQNELLEEQRSRIERTARELQRASALKDRFLASVSHELRTPMTVILGFTGALLRGNQGELNPSQRESLERVQRNAKLLLGLINDVLDISKIESGKMDVVRQRVSLARLLEHVQTDFGEAARRKGLRLTTETAPGLPDVVTDPAKVTQILANLVGNALKFTESGAIHVRAEAGPGPAWTLSVSDTGIGIPPDEQSAVFEEFRQGESQEHRGHGGTGLGLSIVRKLVVLLGGTISLQSAPGRGSTFTVRLPIESPADAPRDERAAGPLDHGRRPRVLVVDDDENVRKLLASELAPCGVDVLEASDGASALAMARERKPAAILLDVLMPKLDGWQTLRALKDLPETRSIPVIILSIVENRAFGLSLGAFDYLVKPIDRGALFAILARVGVLATSGYVLVVDDDPDIRRLFEQELVAAGYPVRAAEGGARALELVEREPPAAVLLDLMMPPPDGFDVLARLRGDPRLRDIKVVIVTAKELSREDERALRESADRVIRKGADLRQLVDSVLQTIAVGAA